MNESENIWHEYHTKLAAFIKKRVNEDDAEDLLQDVFVKFHSRIDTLNENTKLESWLYQITRNTIIDYYRSKRSMVELPEWLEQADADKDVVIRKELSSCLEPMVNKLPDKYRQAVQLSEIENKTQNEVAEIAEITLSGAKSRVQRGRVLLKDMLNACCEIEINNNNQLISYEKKGRDCDC